MSSTHFYIHSQNRLNPFESPATSSIKLNRGIEAGLAELSFFSMPNTWYNITSKNNTFILDAGTITLDAGCYDLTQLLTEIQSLLPAGTTVLYNDVLNKVQITFTSAHILDFSQGNFWKVIGFLPQAYPSGTVFVSSYPPKIYTSMLILKTNMAANIMSHVGNATFVIPVNVNKGELLQFYNRSQFASRPKVNNNNLYRLDLVLCDENENVLEGCGDYTALIAICEKNNATDHNLLR